MRMNNDNMCEQMTYTAAAAVAGIASFVAGLEAGFSGAMGTLLVPGCAAAGGALNVFGAAFIGHCILYIPFSLALS